MGDEDVKRGNLGLVVVSRYSNRFPLPSIELVRFRSLGVEVVKNLWYVPLGDRFSELDRLIMIS